MNPVAVGVVVFASVFGAALAGMWLRTVLPDHHLSTETKDSVRLGMGLVSTMAALVLGLLVASTKDSFESEKNQVIHMAAKAAYLDQVLASYGPEAVQTRVLLRVEVSGVVEGIWPDDHTQPPQLDPSVARVDELHASVHKLSPQTEVQRSLKLEAAELVSSLGEARWLLFEQADSSISTPLLLVVISWLAIIFVSFGLFAPTNHTVTAALLVAALAVAGAIFLILELAQPFSGVIQISGAPLRNALEHLGK